MVATYAIRALSLITVATIHCSVALWLERHLCLIPTSRTNDSIHLLWFTETTTAITLIAARSFTSLRFVYSTARGTAAWRMHQSTAGIQFLLANGENKCLIAVATIQGLITECHGFFSIPGCITQCSCIAQLTIDYPL